MAPVQRETLYQICSFAQMRPNLPHKGGFSPAADEARSSFRLDSKLHPADTELGRWRLENRT